MKKSLVIIIFLAFGLNSNAQLFESIEFPSLDSIIIRADLYAPNKEKAPFILLCHQANSSRGEYLSIAPELIKKGYNCMAIDQRSGDEIAQTPNVTYYNAAWGKRLIDFVTSEQDILASIDYIKDNFPKAKKIVLWGSSYSASLCLKIASEVEGIDAVVAFSPGEYFKPFGKSDSWISDSMNELTIPTFITCTGKESDRTQLLFDKVASRKKTFFVPQGEGIHGSRAFWEVMPDHLEYREAVYKFLKKAI